MLSKRDIDYLENLPDYLGGGEDSMGHVDERQGFIPKTMMDDTFSFDNDSPFGFVDILNTESTLMPYDSAGNVRVLRMLWKSRRKIKKVTWYDEESGEQKFGFFTDDYVIDENKGKEEKNRGHLRELSVRVCRRLGKKNKHGGLAKSKGVYRLAGLFGRMT